MRKYTGAIIIALLLISFSSLAQHRNYTTYKYGDSVLLRTLTKNLLKFHDEEIVFNETNTIIISVISVSKKGKIDSINTWNTTESTVSNAIIDAIERTKNDWLKARKPYKVIIPIYILHNSEGIDKVLINTTDLIPINKILFPFKGIFLEPIFIKISPRIAHN